MDINATSPSRPEFIPFSLKSEIICKLQNGNSNVKAKLKRLPHFSGPKASVYSVLQETVAGEAPELMLDKFLERNVQAFAQELMDICRRLRSLGNVTGCKETFFKPDEGLKTDDCVCALFDVPKRHLRLYCIRLSERIVIVGDGGPKTTRTWQEDKILTRTVHDMMNVSAVIRTKLKNGDLTITKSGLFLDGDLYISNN